MKYIDAKTIGMQLVIHSAKKKPQPTEYSLSDALDDIGKGCDKKCERYDAIQTRKMVAFPDYFQFPLEFMLRFKMPNSSSTSPNAAGSKRKSQNSKASTQHSDTTTDDHFRLLDPTTFPSRAEYTEFASKLSRRDSDALRQYTGHLIKLRVEDIYFVEEARKFVPKLVVSVGKTRISPIPAGNNQLQYLALPEV